jgi:ribosomal protein S18 acetylase RimI-like enzyme
MDIIYNDTRKDLPCGQLHRLFVSVGWSDGTETPDMISNYNIPFKNSTLVVSAWENENLVGAVRVLSDQMFRSVLYDFLVLPDYQNRGIGREMLRRCLEHFPKSEWLVQTTKEISGYYEKNGFKVNSDVFLSIPCQLFTHTAR